MHLQTKINFSIFFLSGLVCSPETEFSQFILAQILIKTRTCCLFPLPFVAIHHSVYRQLQLACVVSHAEMSGPEEFGERKHKTHFFSEALQWVVCFHPTKSRAHSWCKNVVFLEPKVIRKWMSNGTLHRQLLESWLLQHVELIQD